MVVEKNGYKWFVDENNPTTLEPLRDYEEFVITACRMLRHHASTFVDVGANVGKYTIPMSDEYERVIAFEPLPENREILITNLDLNGIDNVIVRREAVGSSRGKAYLTRAGAQSKIVPRPAGNTVEVDVVPLDEVLDCPSVIKVDVEGFELEVVKGALNYTRKYRPVWVIEHHGYWGSKTDPNHFEIARILVELGYLPLAIDTIHWAYLPKDMNEQNLHAFLDTFFGYHVFYTLIVPNLESGRAWYYGIPHNWWWGMSIMEFVSCCVDPFSKEGVERELDKLYTTTIRNTLGITVGR